MTQYLRDFCPQSWDNAGPTKSLSALPFSKHTQYHSNYNCSGKQFFCPQNSIQDKISCQQLCERFSAMYSAPRTSAASRTQRGSGPPPVAGSQQRIGGTGIHTSIPQATSSDDGPVKVPRYPRPRDRVVREIDSPQLRSALNPQTVASEHPRPTVIIPNAESQSTFLYLSQLLAPTHTTDLPRPTVVTGERERLEERLRS